MTSSEEFQSPVYLVGNRPMSISDLLRRFAEKEYQLNGVPRLSDLHLKIGEPARYRFDSQLVPLAKAAPLSPRLLEQLLFPLLTEQQIAELGAGRDVDAAFEFGEIALNFRINAFHDRDGLAATIRVLPRFVPTPEEIGFPSAELYRELTEEMTQGLVIVTGTTGSGKSTTIASLIQKINRERRVRVITLEDPVEYVLPSNLALISQREVGRHIPSFSAGLRSALREDPDIFFVGEMRDPETTYMALTAAETGHLVFSTLHTRDARGALSRIIDMYPPERVKEISTQMSFSLSCIIGQKLCPRADGKGRRAVMEVMKNIPAIAHLIRNNTWQQIYSTMQTQSQHGMVTLERHLLELIQLGEITREDAIRVANVPSALET